MSAFGADTFNSCTVFPKPLLPDVANSVIILLEKSYASRNVLIIVGATYHQIGNLDRYDHTLKYLDYL